jgi:RNA polymerase sigma factor (sigma-70 family)
MTDNNDLATVTSLVTNSRPQIVNAVRIACRKYKYHATPEEMEDFIEQIIVLLLEDDCRRVRTHDPSKSSFKTWLQHVANHYVSRQLQKNHVAESLEDYLLTLSYAPKQEKELLRKEQRAILEDAIDKLSLHDQRIARLKLREVPDEEIAKELNIKAVSVGREWRGIKTKLMGIMAYERQNKPKDDAL